MKIRLNYILLISFFTFFVSSCAVIDSFKNHTAVEDEEVISEAQYVPVKVDKEPQYSAVIKKDSYPEIQTPQGANRLDLETPLRCFVNWETQEMISSIPYNLTAFNLVKNGINDHLPRFEVNGFSFDTMSAERALLKLTKEADIKLVAKDAPYASIKRRK